MAKARLAAPTREVAQIVSYMTGSDVPIYMRYLNMRDAVRDFDKLLKAADKGEGIALSSPCMTCVFRFPQNIAACYLVDIESNNNAMADTQKRLNAMMTPAA